MGHCMLIGGGGTAAQARYLFIGPQNGTHNFRENNESSAQSVYGLNTYASTSYASSAGIAISSFAALDVSAYGTLHFRAACTGIRGTYGPEVGLSAAIVTGQSGATPTTAAWHKFSATGELVCDLDISAVTGSYYVYYRGVAAITITELWLE